MFREQNQCESGMIAADLELKYSLCQQFLTHAKSRDNSLQEICLMYEQNQMLSRIKDQMETSKANKVVTVRDEPQEAYTYEGRCSLPYKTERNTSFKRLPINRASRFTNRPSITERKGTGFCIQNAIKEVQQKCEQETVEQVRALLRKTKGLEFRLAQIEQANFQLQKDKKQLQLLRIHATQLERRLAETDKRLKTTSANTRQDTGRQDKQRFTEREKHVSKCQTAILLKEKRIMESLRGLSDREAVWHKQHGLLAEERRVVEQIWDKIVDKLQCQGDVFKTDIYNKCKQSLKNQRAVLKEESEELDRQHAAVDKIISQLEGVI